MRVAYVDCFSGASGDMLLGACVANGVPLEELREALAGLPVSGYELREETVSRGAITGTRVHVELADQHQPHRHLNHILDIIGKSTLSDRVKEHSSRTFRALAEAEAAVHGSTVEGVHFHEVGAVDAIVDVVGAVLALELLGIDEVLCSPIPVGSGTVECDHGTLPVPAPATVELLEGVPIAASEEVGELTTPTAAAVLTTLARGFGPLPDMTLRNSGCGAGSREGRTRPNLLRVLIGDAADQGDVDQITVLETNLDDVSPEVVGHCIERLLREGARDAYAVPIQMKKSRPGVLLTVLCGGDQVSAMERILFAETTTFGIRRQTAQRTKLRRRHETVTTPFGELRIKVGERAGLVTFSPEYEDCKAAAETHRVPLREVIAAANAAWTARGT